jgi:hypothetical protein
MLGHERREEIDGKIFFNFLGQLTQDLSGSLPLVQSITARKHLPPVQIPMAGLLYPASTSLPTV